MDPSGEGEEQLDYEDEEDYGGGTAQKKHFQTGGAISALADEEELLGEDDEYDDLYNDVNVGESFIQSVGGIGFGAEQNDIAESQQREAINEAEEKPRKEPDGNDNNDFVDKVEEDDDYAGVDSGSNPPGSKVRAPEPGQAQQADAMNRNSAYRGSAKDEDRASGKGRGSVRVGVVGSGPSRGGGSGRNENTARTAASGEAGGSMLFVGELHWWTTDAELESVLSEYGRLKELKFFEEKASGKSKGYCQVEFFDAASAAACKDRMDGHVFNGRPCVVAFASPHTVRQMGSAQVTKNQPQPRKPINDGPPRAGSFYQAGDGGRSYGKMGWGRGGGGGGGNRGQTGQGIARGAVGAKNMGAGHYGQGLPGPPMGILGQGFDPAYGAHMGRAGGYGGFSPHGPPFPGMIPSFPAVGTVGLPGVAPHVNPAFFGRGVAANGMGMMPGAGAMDAGHQAGMWGDSGIGGWAGDEHNRRMRDPGYGEDLGSDYGGYGELGHDRAGRSGAPRDKERGPSERRRHEDREADWDRDPHRDDREGFRDQRPRDRDWENEDDWEKEKSSRSRSNKARIVEDEDQRPRPKEADYAKRRRLPAELNE